jgi:hypothetical protein
MTPVLLAALLLARPAAAAPDVKALASYSTDFSRPLADRVAPIPDWLLDLWRKADETRAYADHALTAAEKREFAAALDGLPAPMRAALSERMIAFYFVANLKGNGITSWVLDASSRTYTYMILNPAAFDKTLSQLLTERERSVYRGAADVSVDAGSGGSGILYTVSHEGAHAFDYARGLTPFTDPRSAAALRTKAPVSWDAWGAYDRPLPADDYPARSRLHFYGFGEPALAAAEGPEVCAQLAASPFASLYGSRSWAEDAAELFVGRHLTRDLGRPYRLLCGGKVFEPMSRPRVAERAERILAPLYSEGAPMTSYQTYADLFIRLSSGATAAQLEDVLPGLSANLKTANEVSAKYWTDSTPFDEVAQEFILPDKILDALSIRHVITGGVVHVPAGLMHTYGYLFSQLKTPYGLKSKRWLESRLDERLGLSAGTFGPLPSKGEFATNVTESFLKAKDIGSIEQKVSWKAPDGHIVKASVFTQLVPLKPLPNFETKDSYLLIYSVVQDGRRRLVTGFPIDDGFAQSIMKTPAGKNASFVPRFNLYIDPSWAVVEQINQGFKSH